MDNHLIIYFGEKKKKVPFAIGGEWNMIDKTEKGKLINIARKANKEHFDNKYIGVALENTPDINDYRAYGFYNEFPRGAHSLAMVFAVSHIGKQTIVDGAPKPIVRFFHLRDESGKEVVWLVVLIDDIIQEDRIIEVMESFNVENTIRSEYGEIDFVNYEIEDSLKTLEELWNNLSKKDRPKTKIISFSGYKKKVLFIAIILSLLGGAAFAGSTWYITKKEEERQVQMKLQQEADAARKIAALKKSEFPPVWMNQPTVAEVFSIIDKTIASTPTVVNGWQYAGFNYQANTKEPTASIKIVYARDAGDAYMTPPGKINPKKPNQCMTQSTIKYPKKERPAGIMKLKNAETWILQASQGQPYKVIYKLASRESKTVNIGSTPVEVTAAYQVMNIQIQNLGSLSGLAMRLNVPGFVITSVTNTKGGWNVKANLYVLP